uniref:Uncharacterized protein n=1 Tax=Salix viminalis TaxID=40686 RepID=A0A6N2LM13_SALVM
MDQFKTNKAFSRECCIYRVPARLRRLNEEAYTPRVVSIGPIHHGKENLKAMDDHKIMYLQQFLDRSKVRVKDLIKVFEGYETALRDCYAETIDYSSREDFATMIILDAVFIIMVLLKFVGESHESGSGDQIFFRPWKFVDVVWDMCLLENQLPFFLLEKLFERYPIKNCTIMELTFDLLKQVWTNWVKEDSREKINCCGVLHLVDFLRKCQQPSKYHLRTKKTRFSSANT